MKINTQSLMHHFKILALGMLLLMTACSPSRRLARILKNNPELTRTDTITKLEIRQGFSVDTAFIMLPGDTVTITRNIYKDTLIRAGENDFIHKAEMPADTVKLTTQITNISPGKYGFFSGRAVWPWAAFICGFVLGWLLKRFF